MKGEDLRNKLETDIMQSLPISKVVFFKLKKGKYFASNGVELTIDFIIKHEHAIYLNDGYVILERE